MSDRRSKQAFALAIAGVLCFACDARDREIEHERGDLIYSGTRGGLYRSGRRVELVAEDSRYPFRPGCGYLTERAEADIDRVLVSLDPEADYTIDRDACESRWLDGASARVHIEGFTHSPFICSGFLEDCCTDEIAPLEALYVRVMAYLEGLGEDNDAVLETVGIDAYPMIEPDEPCAPGRSR